MIRLGRGPEEGVPRDVQGALDRLTPHLRQATACLQDCANQARPHHWPASHLVDVVGGHGLCPSVVVLVGEPAVLQPAGTDQVSGLVEDVGEIVKLGKPCTGLVTSPQLSDEAALGPPTWMTIDIEGQESGDPWQRLSWLNSAPGCRK